MPPVPRWLVDDATPEALAGLLATYGRIALLSAPKGTCSTRWPAATTRAAGPNLGVYLKGHAGDLLKVDRRGRPPEYVERPCLTIGLTVQPEVLRGLASRPGFGGRGLLARFLYSLPQSLVGRRQAGAPPVPPAVADRYTLELQALAASLTAPASDDGPTVLTLDPAGGRAAARASSATWSRGWPPTAATWPTWPAGRPSSPAPPAASPASCTWPATSATAGPSPSAPTPSPAPSGWPTTWSSTPGRCST